VDGGLMLRPGMKVSVKPYIAHAKADSN
jgi:hypothetical protein